MIALWLLWGCQEPFGLDRHRLEGDRIVAVEALVADDGTVQPEAALVVGGRLFQDDAPEMRWAWIDGDDLGDGERDSWDAEAARPVLPVPEATPPTQYRRWSSAPRPGSSTLGSGLGWASQGPGGWVERSAP